MSRFIFVITYLYNNKKTKFQLFDSKKDFDRVKRDGSCK